MNYYKENLERLIAYFSEGIKKDGEDNLGLELEHFVTDKKTGKTVDYYAKNGIQDLLKSLAAYYKDKTYVRNGQYLIGVAKAKSNITLEPAAQLEISIGPYEKVSDIENEYRYFIEKVTPFLRENNYELIPVGYQPKSKIDEMRLIPKKRYEFMLSYFGGTGSHGKNMMKGTASAQVSVDYHSEEDFKKKFRAANILAPALSLLTDNTPYFEGEKNDEIMKRTIIWNDVDSDRSMIVSGALDREFGFKEYAEYLMNSPAVLVQGEDGTKFTGEKLIRDIYADKLLQRDEIEHIISMFFPDVRLKNYVEIRMADSLPLEYALSYTALIKGLFYCGNCVDKILKRFEKVGNKDIADSKLDLIDKGYDGSIYGESVYDLIMKLFQMAYENLPEYEKDYLNPLYELAKEKKRPVEVIHE